MNFCKDCKFYKGQMIVFDKHQINLIVCHYAYMMLKKQELKGIQRQIYEKNISLLKKNKLKDINGDVRNDIKFKTKEERQIVFDEISDDCPFKLELMIQKLNNKPYIEK